MSLSDSSNSWDTGAVDEDGQPKKLKKKFGDFLGNFMKKRPSPDDLREKNILMAPSSVAPRIQPSRFELEKNLKSPRKESVSRGGGKKNKDLSLRDDSLGGGSNSDKNKTAWETLRNLDFTFSKFSFGNAVVHRLKFPQFGLSPDELQDLYPDQPDGIPLVLTKGMEYLKSHLDTEGLFRVNGSNKDISMQKFKIEDGDLSFEGVDNPYCVCGLISTFFKELPQPLIPCDRYNEVIDIVRNPDESEQNIVIKLRQLVLSIPPSHLCILKKLIEFLSLVESHKDKNKMNSDNLGIVFGPTLIRDPEFKDISAGLVNLKLQSYVIKYMIDFYNPIFKSMEVKSAYRKSMVVQPPRDTSSIDYLDPASIDDKRESVHIIANGSQTVRPRPPPRRTGTILLSPRQDSSDMYNNNNNTNNSTLTRPMSRIFNPEVLDSPIVAPANCPKPPPKPPTRKPTLINPMPIKTNVTTTTTTTTTSTTPTPTKSAPVSIANTTNRFGPSTTTTKASPPLSTSPSSDSSAIKTKPPPPKRTYLLDSPNLAPQLTRSNTISTSTPISFSLSGTSTTTGGGIGTPHRLDKPPNKPPPNPQDYKYKTTPSPQTKQISPPLQPASSSSTTTTTTSLSAPPTVEPVRKRVQFGTTTTLSSSGETKLKVPDSSATTTVVPPKSTTSTTPLKSSDPVTTGTQTKGPTVSLLTTTAPKSNSYIKFTSTTSGSNDSTNDAKKQFTTQRTSKSDMNLSTRIEDKVSSSPPKSTVAATGSLFEKTNFRTFQPLRVSPDLKPTTGVSTPAKK
ncbi:hypothetical protein SAMD00019534_043790 [Acytostelium subglobosum LB1]|uniref:hypothetical protein n=1 Tax=Acytostelium subglobosum LB1 TaxID=1410327 RepID=UPI000644DA8F|nr:hypothetical protein SAMD00019534_043790 [Acytostelium subglobosum LB1]GAM21204.1 hypothetical protein SAMD00019534_043790 [Acytostelium subglobosum LB1]|eukprot:XP_012756338.1 hypothetical protein SAMD00019534_043790 [Acytostelium subglobosum LB1]